MSHDAPTTPAQRALQLLGLDAVPASGLLVLLLIADGAVIASYLSMEYLGEPMHPTFDLSNDRGFGEFFQYLQILWAATMLVLLAVRRRVGVYAAWALVCVFFVLDDGLQMHEQAGTAIGETLPALEPVAELVWMGAAGIVLSIVVLFAHLRADAADRAVSRLLVILFAVLIFFGVVIDAVYPALIDHPALYVPMTVIEDGGEIVTMSVMVAFLFAVVYVAHRPGGHRPPAQESVDLDRVGGRY